MAVSLQVQSPLFKLSGELRNRIYEQVSINHPNNHEPALFLTCRQIRNEGRKLFYATHTFVLSAKDRMNRMDPTNYQHFLTRLGVDKAAMIEHLRIEVGNNLRHFQNPQAESVFVDVRVDAGKAEVLSACFSHEGVSKKAVGTLETAKNALNAAWATHENPTKIGLLRTLPALVPQKVKVGDGNDVDGLDSD